jgi:hypothetical protein
LVVGDERLAERRPVDGKRQVIAADSVGFRRLGTGRPERVRERARGLVPQNRRLGLAEKPAQRQVPERGEMQDLLVRKHGKKTPRRFG